MMERLYFDSLIQWKNKKNRKPLIFKGARQVGKTYLLKEFGTHHFEKYHYFNFEKDPSLRAIFEKSLDPEKIIKALSIFKNINIDTKKDLIIFDEIQTCPLALTSLKYFCEDLPHSYICSAGSLLGLYSEEPSFPVGKVEFLNLYPMNFKEFLMALSQQHLLDEYMSMPSSYLHELLWQNFKLYLFIGGLPEAVKSYKDTKDLSLISQIQENLINGYISDMAKHCGKENAMFLQRLWQTSAEKIGQNCSEKFKFKGVFPGKKTYKDFAGPIDWLTKAGLIHIIPIVDQIQYPLSLAKKENAFKIFNFDIGILNHLKGISAHELNNYDFSHKGFIVENYFYQEIQTKNFNFHQQKFYCFQSGESEIEFIYENEGQLTAIEIKAGKNTKAKSLKLFLEKHPKAKGIRFSQKLAATNIDQSIKFNRIWDRPLFLI